MTSIYLDYAAATPCDPRALDAMGPFLGEQFYNPAAAYGPARAVRVALDESRHSLAMSIGAQPTELVLVASATESANAAIHGVMRQYGGRVAVAAIEHSAVLAAAAHYDCDSIAADGRGYVDADAVSASITNDTTLVCVAYANSELGTIQPLRDIAEVVAAERARRLVADNDRPIYLYTDASQAAGMLDISVARLGVDLMTLSSAKCYGPRGAALLWARSGIQMAPLIDGGGQERGIRGGTENVAAIKGFAQALYFAERGRKHHSFEVRKRRDALQTLLVARLPELVVNGHPRRRLPSHLHVSLPGLDGERAVFALDMAGVYVATGSACSANKGVRSHVLTAVGMSAELADGSLRLSLGRDTTDEMVTRAADIIAEVLVRERALS
jgi:cysteine desulfurase